MGKLIFFLLIIGGIYYYFIKKEKNIKNLDKESYDENDLIMCDKCKTFTPKNEIKKINGKYICKDCYDNSK